ncbi:glycosyltransferase family 2 protein [Candidatus Halobeggiatoa sp. HSG11]|nr:glycosyltransferase family 2 protein [Candidatus Halobeggiatoa sp. HSG11]
MNNPQVSVIIVSFNTRDLLRDCLNTLIKEAGNINYEIIVIDNASKDDSANMVATEFPDIKLICSTENLGFAAANNLGFAQAQGDYIVLLNSDAFLWPHALERSLEYIQANPKIGIGGARLINPDESWQPSARLFPSLLNHLIVISGLANKYPKSKFFGRMDRTWADTNQAASVDWVPGAFSIMPRKVLEKVGYFDEQFFLYCEEVDLCKRFKMAGYEVYYWPDVTVIHLGGESSKSLTDLEMSTSGKQINLWQIRSTLLYYRKHHGLIITWLWMQLENNWHLLRIWKNCFNQKANNSKTMRKLLKQAWHETQGGKISPPRPW